MIAKRFRNYAWAVLGYNILVILWGAYVRATGSGAGCGRHWPLCNGAVVPRAPEIETIIEFTHRLTSGLAGVLVIVLLVWAWRTYKPGHAVRKAAAFSLLFIITEGLVGAGLVLLEWVGGDDSVGRAVMMAVHLSNTFLLLGVLTLTAWWAGRLEVDDVRRPLQLSGQGVRGWVLGIALLLVMVVSAAGAVTALGDTLFPSETLAEGVARDFSPTAHFLERLRIWHPVLAVLTAIYIFAMLGLLHDARFDTSRYNSSQVQRLTRLVQMIVGLQLLAGVVNLLLLAPVWMQIVHLLLADAVWISLIAVGAEALAAPQEEAAPEALDLELQNSILRL
jgi:heme A synthase